MKTLFKTFAYAAIAALAFSSCAKENLKPADEITGKLVTVHFGTENTDPSTTKATLTPDAEETAFEAAWENDDQIYISYSLDYAEAKLTTGTWKGTSFEAELLTEGNGDWKYDAAYPVPANDKSVDFGSSRTQKGNAFNSKYDIMIGSAVAEGADAGKDDKGNNIVFEMTRQTAIAYFHFTSELDEPIVSATLTVEDGAIANSAATIEEFKFNAPVEGNLSEIVLSFEGETAPSAKDFQLWFNVLPTSYTSMSLTVETDTKTFTISKATEGKYEAGKLYKVKKENILWKTIPTTIFFYESFDKIDGKGGNDNQWNGSIAANDIISDNNGWTYENAKGASQCIKVGSSSKGTATTPSLNITANKAKLWFKAGAWDNSSEKTTINVSVSGNGTITPSSITLVIGAWTEYDCIITGADAKTRIIFSAIEAKNNRFFLDEVYVYSGPKPSTKKLSSPSNLSCTAQTGNSLTFSWDPVANASGYQVSLDGGVNYGATQTETTYTWSGLSAGTTKTLYVKAIGDGSSYTDSDAAYAEGTTTAGSSNPGVTTASLDETEIKNLGQIAYTTENVIKDGAITWTVYAFKDQATRPWLQLKKDSNVYVKITAPSAIKEVRLTITSTTNSSGGVENISKHTVYSSTGKISLKSADAAGDKTTNDVVSCTGKAISNNKVTLVPTGGSYSELYLKVSTGARIWGIEVDY